MAILTVMQGEKLLFTIPFTGTPTVHMLTEKAGLTMPHPCGGRGKCGKCVIDIKGDLSQLTEIERRVGHRLSCQTKLLGDAVLTLSEDKEKMLIESEFEAHDFSCAPMSGTIGAAVDIGTTTVVLRLYDLSNGKFLADASAVNPQTSVAADVIGRIGAAKDGKGALLSDLISNCIRNLKNTAAQNASISEKAVDRFVMTGNTTMLYLFTNRDPDCLSHTPFMADTLFGTEWRFDGVPAFLPHCMSAFVGADISTAVLSSGMTNSEKTALLCDIGTNGEIALWKNGRLYVSSTAAGPAFEGAGISCGCSGIPGAIDRVLFNEKGAVVHTIGDIKAVGVCGSGLIDAVAYFLNAQIIDETGALDGDTSLADGIMLTQKDIRAVQLAKAAIAAGIHTLLQVSGTKEDEIDTLYIAGGFGNHLNIESAVRIGLIPASLASKSRSIGNAALAGAVMLMLDKTKADVLRTFALNAKTVNLGGNPAFNERYMDEMLFPDEE